MPLPMPHRQFAVLVAGPMFRVKARSKELAKIISTEIEKHLGDVLVRDARKPAATVDA
jgi:adenylyl- and sulfurtransferase ThiI